MPKAAGVPRIESLTIVRGIAAWWVVAFHFGSYLRPYISLPLQELVSKGYLAVDLFFCLSGYVIFINYRTLQTSSGSEIFAFYVKRLSKIYPLHLFTILLYVGLLATILASGRSIPPQRFSAFSLMLNVLLIQNWVPSDTLSWNVPAWSISAEFAAYLLFPFIVLPIRQFVSRTTTGIAVIAVLICLLNLAYSTVGFELGDAIGKLGVLRCVIEFSIGAVIAQILHARSVHRLARPILLIISALFVYFGFRCLDSFFIPVAWAAAIAAIAQRSTNLNSRLYRPFIVLGEISYATYMVHYFIRDIFKLAFVHTSELTPLATVLAALVAILIASVPLYFIVERGAQRWLLSKASRIGLLPKANKPSLPS